MQLFGVLIITRPHSNPPAQWGDVVAHSSPRANTNRGAQCAPGEDLLSLIWTTITGHWQRPGLLGPPKCDSVIRQTGARPCRSRRLSLSRVGPTFRGCTEGIRHCTIIWAQACRWATLPSTGLRGPGDWHMVVLDLEDRHWMHHLPFGSEGFPPPRAFHPSR